MRMTCSNLPRPTTPSGGNRGGGQWWIRDVHHLTINEMTTLCGRNCTEWLDMGGDIDSGHGLCSQCRKRNN